ncbi:MAG: hypothetical protein ACOCQW_00750 [Halanaerobiaceae bacterium]
MKKVLLVLALIFMFTPGTMAATYRIGGTTAGSPGFEYRTNNGVGYSFGLVSYYQRGVNDSTNYTEPTGDFDYDFGFGLRKLVNVEDASFRAYYGGAYIPLKSSVKAELGIQWNVWNGHLAINPGVNFWYHNQSTFNKFQIKPSFGMGLEF